jgi:predicted  nucleic acid-binding Zn-ribbon protein
VDYAHHRVFAEVEANMVKCPRCGGTVFKEVDAGPDTFDDDVTWTAHKCQSCGLWYSEWLEKWLINSDGTNLNIWQEEENAMEFKLEKSI